MNHNPVTCPVTLQPWLFSWRRFDWQHANRWCCVEPYGLHAAHVRALRDVPRPLSSDRVRWRSRLLAATHLHSLPPNWILFFFFFFHRHWKKVEFSVITWTTIRFYHQFHQHLQRNKLLHNENHYSHVCSCCLCLLQAVLHISVSWRYPLTALRVIESCTRQTVQLWRIKNGASDWLVGTRSSPTGSEEYKLKSDAQTALSWWNWTHRLLSHHFGSLLYKALILHVFYVWKMNKRKAPFRCPVQKKSAVCPVQL